MSLDFRRDHGVCDMNRSRLNARERTLFRSLNDDVIDLRYNWPRRLRNALLCLAMSDPRWMIWVECEIDPEIMSLQEMTRLVEARARWITLRPHSFFGRKCIGDFIFRDNWTFTDRGNLSAG